MNLNIEDQETDNRTKNSTFTKYHDFLWGEKVAEVKLLGLFYTKYLLLPKKPHFTTSLDKCTP